MTESIAVSSGKGGVGKTTIAVNIALTLAKNGNKTLLLDADLGMANAHLVLGVNPEKSLDDFISKKVPISKAKTTIAIESMESSVASGSIPWANCDIGSGSPKPPSANTVTT